MVKRILILFFFVFVPVLISYGTEPMSVNEIRNGQQDVFVIEQHQVPPLSAEQLPREVSANPIPQNSPFLSPVKTSINQILPPKQNIPQNIQRTATHIESPKPSVPLPTQRLPVENQNLYTVSHISIQQLEQTLRTVLQHRLTATAPGRYTFTVIRSPANGQPHQSHCVLEFDYSKKHVYFTGEPVLREQFFQLMRSIDQTAPSAGRYRQIISISNVSPVSLTKILEINRTPASKIRHLQTSQTTMPQTPAAPQNNGIQVLSPQSTPAPQLEYRPSAYAPVNTIQPVSYQAEIPMDTGGGALPNDPTMPPAANNGMDTVTNFNYQILPDLDVLIMEAPGTDVARFKEMIDQIAELSKSARPDIEVYPLKYVNCISLNYVLMQVYADVLATRQGAVRFQPMVNPNAMLIVGRGDAMTAVKDLIKSLDQPVAAEHSLLKVIKLKHASAQYVLTTLRGAFPALPAGTANAFAPRLQLFADARTNSLIVQAGQNDMADIEKMIAGMDVEKTDVKHQIRQFKAKHTLASDLAAKLNQTLSAGIAGTADRKTASLQLLVETKEGKKTIESGLLTDVKITAHDPTSTVIVTGPEHCMLLIEELINVIDSPSATAVVKVFPIMYGDAQSMITTLRDLLPTQLSGETGPQLPAAKDEDALVPVRFSVDIRTNCILAAGTEGDLKVIEGLLYSLDREDQQTRKNYVYMLKSMQAMAVSTAINAYIRDKRLIRQQSPGVISPYQQIESEVIVIPEVVSNSLIVSATPKFYDEVLNLIKEIDQPPPQVIVQVLIGEVTLGSTKELGAEFGLQDSLLFNRSTFNNIQNTTRTITQTLADGTKTVIEEPYSHSIVNPGWLFNENPQTSLGSDYNTVSSGSAGNVGSQLLTNFGTGRIGAETGFGGMVFSANSDAVSIMIRALQETNRLEVLSRPQIMAMNNQESVIHVGQRIRLVGNVTMTSFGAQSGMEPDKVGLMLTVKPSISPEGNVVMFLNAEKSSLGPESEGTVVSSEGGNVVRSPKINVINAMTMISAADNETVVLGGLISTTDQDLTRKVPLLAEIPIVGRLFRYDYKRTQRSELLIILTPRIIRDKKDIESVKQIETARMNWCLAGVSKLHGDIGAYSVVGKEPYIGDVPVVFPEAVKEEELKPLNDVPAVRQQKLPPPPVLRLAPEQK